MQNLSKAITKYMRDMYGFSLMSFIKNKYQFTFSTADKTLLVILIGRIFQIIATLVTIKLITYFLSSEEVAILFLITAITSYFGLGFINPVGQYINRRIHSWQNNKTIVQNFKIYNYYVLLVSFLALILVVCFKDMANIVTPISSTNLAILVMFGIYFNTWANTIIPTLNMLNFRISFAVFTNLVLILGIALSFLLINLFTKNAYWWFVGQTLAQLVFSIIAWYFLKQKLQEEQPETQTKMFSSQKINKTILSKIFYYSFPLALSTIFMWLQNEGFRFPVEKLCGLHYLGVLSIGFVISQKVCYAIESIVQQIFYPVFYKNINSSNKEMRMNAWRNLFQTTLPIYLYTFFFFLAISPILIIVLSNNTFPDILTYLIIGLAIQFFRMMTNIFSNIAHSEMKTTTLIIPYMFGSIIGIILIYISNNFFKQNSEILIPLSILCGYIATLVITFFQMKKLVHISLAASNILKYFIKSIPFLFGCYFIIYSKHGMFFQIVLAAISMAYYLYLLWKLYLQKKNLLVV